MKLIYQSIRLYTIHYSEWGYHFQQLCKFLNGEMKHYLVLRLWVCHVEQALGKKKSTWQLLEVLGHWESCHSLFTEGYLSQRWAMGLVCRKVCYIINFKFSTYDMATYFQTTQSPTLRHVQGASTHAHTHTHTHIYIYIYIYIYTIFTRMQGKGFPLNLAPK